MKTTPAQKPQPPSGFTVIYRNYGHWDITAGGSRVFRIRGGPGRFRALDERERPYPSTEFKTLTACMSFITDQLMFEHITPEKEGTGNNEPIARATQPA